jgi:uncharacterized membrane protein
MTSGTTSTGLKENVASLLCYLGWWVTGIIFLIIEPNNKTIRFHAIQSIVIFGIFFILSLIFTWIWFIGTILWIISVITWVFMMYKAYQGGTYHLPVAGQIADRFIK